MNKRREDFEFLRAFARRGDQPAFAALLRRHLDLVYGTALRRVGDDSAAQEIAQNVFAALARKAWQFAPDDSLPAWLHRTALLEAKQWLRGELRRRRREQTAAELGTTMKTPDEHTALRALIPLLDDALLSLRDKDRTALLLRYYENQSLREVGNSLGLAEDAAQKRVATALDKLAQFFQRRGFRTVTVAAAAATLQATASSAPAAVAASIAQTTLQLAPALPAVLSSLLSQFAGLTKAQTAGLCLALAAAPVIWQWIDTRAAEKAAVRVAGGLNAVRAEQDRLVAEIEVLRVESARLDSLLTEADQGQARNEEAARKLEILKTRLRSLLTDSNYRSPVDLPYVRVPKSVVKDIDLMSKFDHGGAISEAAKELYGITSEEKLAAEQALGNYWLGVDNLMAARAYETNLPSSDSTHSGRVTRTVIVPPLGQDLKSLAADTRRQLEETLGAEREKLLFGGWDEGAIQIFWPGNLWKISEEPQNFTCWVDPATATTNGPLYGASWSSRQGGTSGNGKWAFEIVPGPIASQFFTPWLQQFGIRN